MQMLSRHGLLRRAALLTACAGLLAQAPGIARAASPLTCVRVPDGSIRVDGLRGDWRDVAAMRLDGANARGGDKSHWQGPPDLLGKLRCAHDKNGTYLLLEVDDDQVVRSARYTTREDRVELLFPGPRGRLRVLRIHPPNARHRRGRVRWTRRPYRAKGIRSSVIRLRHGYAIELHLASGSVPGYGVGTPLLRTTLRIVDHDGGVSRTPDTVLLTGGETPATLGRIEYDTAKALYTKFLRDKGLRKQNVLHHEVGNFITGKALEQIVVAGTWLAFIGEDVMEGGAYFALPVPFAKRQQDLLRFRTLDLDGNGNKDVILVVRQEGSMGLSRDMMVIIRFLDSGKPDLYFVSEVAVRKGSRSIEAHYTFRRQGKHYELIMTPSKVVGWNRSSFHPTGGGRIENIPTPWSQRKRVYTFASDGYREK